MNNNLNCLELISLNYYNEKQNLHIEYVKTMNKSTCLQTFLSFKIVVFKHK